MDQLTSEQMECKSTSRLPQRAAAYILGITYQHLSATLKGKRQANRTLERYRELIDRHGQGRLTEVEVSALREFRIIGLSSKVLGVFPERLVSVLSGSGSDTSLLKRFRALAALSADGSVMLSMISKQTPKQKRSNYKLNE